MRITLFICLLLTTRATMAQLDTVACTVHTYVYKKAGPDGLKLDVFAPAIDKKPRPVIILFHGGSWISGNRSQLQGQCRFFVQQGLVAVTADYRLVNKDTGQKEVCIIDARSVVRWIKSHSMELHIDTGKVLLGGASAGGHLATMAILDQALNDPEDDQSIPVTAKALVLFNPAYQPAEPPAVEPFQYVNAHCPPVIFFFGSKDKWRPAADSFRVQLRTAGVYTETWIAEGQTHGFFNKAPWTMATCIRAQAFLAKYGMTDPPSAPTALLTRLE